MWLLAVKEVSHLRRRSEEHTSELQSQSNLVCRLLLEKKKNHHDIRCQTSGLTGFPDPPQDTQIQLFLTLRPPTPLHNVLAMLRSRSACSASSAMQRAH